MASGRGSADAPPDAAGNPRLALSGSPLPSVRGWCDYQVRWRTVRDTGIDVIGGVPWGTHFCQFYQDKQDLIDVLVPYFAAGLKQNEFCMWVTSEPLGVDEAKAALTKVMGDLEPYVRSGQLEILSYSEWYTAAGSFEADRVLQGWVDKLAAAQQRGFDGLRLTGNTFWLEQPEWRDFTDYEAMVNSVIGQYKMLAMCTYSLAKCGAPELLDVMSNHAFALIKREGAWQIIESAERRKTEQALRESEGRYSSLFENMLDGYAYCRMLYDNGTPQDFLYLDVNSAFERLTGLKGVAGKKVSEVIPGIREANPELFQVCGRVARSGRPERFETYLDSLGLWFSVAVYSPAEEHFVAVFENITERKQAEERTRLQNAVLASINKAFEGALADETEAELGRTCLRVAEEVTGSKFGFIGEIGPDGLLHDVAISDPGWELCTMYDKTGHRRPPGDFTIHGLYGRVVNDGRSLLTNAPAQHPDSIGTPEGHPGLTAFLGVPLVREGRTIGMIVVGNREGGYRPEDQEALEALAPAVVEAFLRKRAEDEIRRNEARLESLLRVSQHPAGSIQELLDFALDEAIVLTGSKIGYIYHYDDTKEEFTLNTWSNDVMKQCTIVEQQTRYQLEKTGIWGEAVRQARPIIVNDFQAPHPLKKGYPDGHAPLHRYMTVPIFSDGRIVGVVGVANKDTDYNSADVRQLILLMESVWMITARKRAEEALLAAERERAGIAERMTAEINHRMKNNLMLLSGVLEMQASALPADSGAAAAIQSAISRISSLSAVHEQLYREQPGAIELRDLVRRIGEIDAQALASQGVALSVTGGPCYVTAKLGSTIAILVNELITNAVKYGAPGDDGRLQVRVELAAAEDGMLLGVWNSGNSLPAGFDPQRQAGLGLSLVQSVISQQLGGSFAIHAHGGGTLAQIRLPEKALSSSFAVAEQTIPGPETS